MGLTIRKYPGSVYVLQITGTLKYKRNSMC